MAKMTQQEALKVLKQLREYTFQKIQHSYTVKAGCSRQTAKEARAQRQERYEALCFAIDKLSD